MKKKDGIIICQYKILEFRKCYSTGLMFTYTFDILISVPWNIYIVYMYQRTKVQRVSHRIKLPSF